MVVAALLVGVVLAVGSVPVAAYSYIKVALHTPLADRHISEVEFVADGYYLRVERESGVGWKEWFTTRTSEDEALDWSDQPMEELLRTEDPRPAFARAPLSYPGRYVFTRHLASGWPLPSAKGRILHQDYVGSGNGDRQGLVAAKLGKTRLSIPVRPIWPGLLANTLFYAALAVTPMVLLRWWRTRRRRARGLCVACGYELGEGVAACPECGLESRRS